MYSVYLSDMKPFRVFFFLIYLAAAGLNSVMWDLSVAACTIFQLGHASS